MVGGKKLSGKIKVSGSKNAVLPIMAASILSDKEVVIHDVPSITDVAEMTKMLEIIGAKVKKEGNVYTI